MQTDSARKSHLKAFASRLLTAAEKNYSVTLFFMSALAPVGYKWSLLDGSAH